jgi:hypothetical protein
MAENGAWVAIAGALIAAVAALVVAVVTAFATYASKGQEVRARLVEIAITILRGDPKESPVRDWAIRVIDKNSNEKFTDEEKKALSHTRIVGISAEMNVTEPPDSAQIEGTIGPGPTA